VAILEMMGGDFKMYHIFRLQWRDESGLDETLQEYLNAEIDREDGFYLDRIIPVEIHQQNDIVSELIVITSDHLLHELVGRRTN